METTEHTTSQSTQRNGSNTYPFVVPSVSREFYDHIQGRFPMLDGLPEIAADRPQCRNRHFRKILLGYLMFTRWLDEDTQLPIVPRDFIAALAGISRNRQGFKSEDYLDDFHKNVCPLEIQEYRYSSGQCRTAKLLLDPETDKALRKELEAHLTNPNRETVNFLTGQKIGERQSRKSTNEYIEQIKAKAGVDSDHPALELFGFLEGQPSHTAIALYRRNRPRLSRVIFAHPQDTPEEKRQRDYLLRVLFALDNYSGIHYKQSNNSSRLWAVGTTIHSLPRELRKIALAGSVEFDLRSCQLAIVSKLWNVPSLDDFLAGLLATKKSVWNEFCGFLDLEQTDDIKGILKRTVYAICFGKSRSNLTSLMAYGIDEGKIKHRGLGREYADKFFLHPIVVDLLNARDRRSIGIIGQGGIQDAFGRFIEAKLGTQEERRSLLAQEAQSAELKLLMSVLPIFKAESDDIRLVSWLHDGFSIKFTNASKKGRQIRRICQTVNDEANRLGIPTELEYEELI